MRLYSLVARYNRAYTSLLLKQKRIEELRSSIQNEFKSLNRPLYHTTSVHCDRDSCGWATDKYFMTERVARLNVLPEGKVEPLDYRHREHEASEIVEAVNNEIRLDKKK